MPLTKQKETGVTRTFRAAIRIGEDYITLEETISLPLEARDEDIVQAVALGWQIYTRQREAMEAQVATMREVYSMTTPPEAPASERQRNYINVLQHDLSWTHEQLVRYAEEHGVAFATMSRSQASSFIDNLKKIAGEEREAYHSSPTSPSHPPQDENSAFATESETSDCQPSYSLPSAEEREAYYTAPAMLQDECPAPATELEMLDYQPSHALPDEEEREAFSHLPQDECLVPEAELEMSDYQPSHALPEEEEREAYHPTPSVSSQSPKVSHPSPAPRKEVPHHQPAHASSSERITERQLHALERLAKGRGVELDEETKRRFGVTSKEIRSDQAGDLIKEWQQR